MITAASARLRQVLRHSVIAILFPFVLSATGAELHAQFAVYVPKGVSTPDPLGFFTALPGTTCKDGTGQVSSATMYAGSFLKINTPYQIDTAAVVTGWCEWWLFGQHYRDETRNLNAVGVTGYPPSGSNWYKPVWAERYRQDLDTRVAGTSSGPFTDMLQSIGKHRITFQSSAFSTMCSIPTESAIVEKTLYGVNCAPVWWQVLVNGSLANAHVPPGVWNVYLPPNMYDILYHPADDAATDWESRTTGSDVDFRIVDYDCSEEQNCIVVSDDYNGDGCAAFTGTVLPDGTIVGPANLQFPGVPYSISAERLQRSMAHEFAHALGLYHDLCTAEESLMAEATSCTELGTMSVGPTTQNVGTVHAIYTNKVKKVCGF